MSNEVVVVNEYPVVCVGGGIGIVSFDPRGRSAHEIRADILRIKDQLMALPGDHRELHVEHERVDGMYVRRLYIPKYTLLVGKIHRKTCLNFVQQGLISILTEHGSRNCAAGFYGVSKPGIQKLGYAHEDTIFVNVFRTDGVDIAEIEQEVACESHDLLMIEGD